MIRNILFLLAICGLILTGFIYWWTHLVDTSPPFVQKPTENPYRQSISAGGIIESRGENVAIGTPVSGIIQEVYVSVGNKVKKGAQLFKMDDRDLIAELYVQKANIQVAEAKVQKVEDQLSRLQAVKDPRAVSQEEVKTKENERNIAEAELAQARALVKQTLALLDRLVVKAPKAGVILQSNVRVGEFVQAAGASPLILLGEDQLQVRIDVDELNSSFVREEQNAIAYLKNNPNYKIPLKFLRVEPYVIPKQSLTGFTRERVDTRVLQVIYSIEEKPDFPIYVGQQVEVYIDTGT